MPLQLWENFPSRSLSEGHERSNELAYIVTGTSDEMVAKGMVAAATPAVYNNLFRQQITGQETAPEVWEFRIHYGPLKPPEPGDFALSFDFTGGTMHITQAKANVNNYAPAGQVAPNLQGTIGDDGEGNIAGCDIVVPVYNFTEKWQIDTNAVTPEYKAKLWRLTGKTNQAVFRGFAAAEVLFLGASGSLSARNPAVWEITFKFAASPNTTGITIGQIIGIAKKGWEYLWVRYETVTDGNPARKIQRPASVHVERVYDAGNFTDLGIGTE